MNEKRVRVEGQWVNEKARGVSKEEERAALRSVKCGKAVGPDDIPVESWRCLGENTSGSFDQVV